MDEFERLKRRNKAVIAMKEMPEEFIRAMQEPHFDAERRRPSAAHRDY